MNPFTITLTHQQVSMIFNALQFQAIKVQEQTNELIRYIDSEFAKANAANSENKATEEDKKDEQAETL